MSNPVMVGMAEIKVCCTPDGVLTALGLGSCVGVCVFDPTARVIGMAHIVLPKSGGTNTSPGKFADTGIPLLLKEMEAQGASLFRVRVALVGGAQLFSFQGSNNRLEVGARNIQAVQTELSLLRLSVVAEDIGGKVGRTVNLHANGIVRVRSIGQEDRELVDLARSRDLFGNRLAKVA